MEDGKRRNSPNIGNLPGDLHTKPVDLEHHWTVLDQTKAEFRKSGRSGVVILGSPEDDYRAKVERLPREI